MAKRSMVKMSYTGFQDSLEVTIGWRELEVIVDAINEYIKKWKEFDPATQETFDDLKYILRENKS